MSFTQTKFTVVSVHAYKLEMLKATAEQPGMFIEAGATLWFWCSDLMANTEMVYNIARYLNLGYVTADEDGTALTSDSLMEKFYSLAPESWHPAVATLVLLKAIPAADLKDKMNCFSEDVTTGGTWRYDAQSVSAPDDVTVAKPDCITLPAAGRWLKTSGMLVVHDHSTPAQGGKLAQANTHESADTDVGDTSIHHTCGVGAHQAVTYANLFKDTATVYVSKAGHDTNGDGTFYRPYLTVQKGVDMCSAGGMVVIFPGLYAENVVVSDSITLKGVLDEGLVDVEIRPAAGTPLIITNATPVSLAAFIAAGGGDANYALLVNDGAGPSYGNIEGLSLRPAAGHALQLIGVKGDAGAGVTDFLNRGFNFDRVKMYGTVFGRTFGQSAFCEGCYCTGVNFKNFTYFFLMSMSEIRGSVTLDYVLADPIGEPTAGLGYFASLHAEITGSVYGNGAAVFGDHTAGVPVEYTRITGDLDFDDTSVADLRECIVEGNTSFEGTSSGVAEECYFGGTFIALAGIGTVALYGGRIMGAITDATNKIVWTPGVYDYKIQKGRATISDLNVASVITFARPFADVNYNIQLSVGEIGALAWANTTVSYSAKLMTGFTINIGGAPGMGNATEVSWEVKHD